ncbi:MAG TPA: hypothetical protein VKF84_04560 [Candidatus Sulfotelmatobacter sp.]|nr:hypothetical protein [Candidatus Sulfotelmatobacter sp.]
MPETGAKRYQNTTVRLPRHVYEQAKTVAVQSQASSFNEFVVEAIEEKVRRLAEAEIDEAFAQMANDADYQRNSVTLAQAFEKSDWEALEPASPEPARWMPVIDLAKPLKKSSSDKAAANARPPKTRSR